MGTPLPPPRAPLSVEELRRHQRRNGRLTLWVALLVGVIGLAIETFYLR